MESCKWRSILNNNTLRIKDLQENDRPYERCRNLGAEALSDAELLSIIIKNGTKSQTAIEIAHELLHKTGNGLQSLPKMHLEELTTISGIGFVKAIQIKALCELSKRMAKAENKDKISVENPETVALYYGQDLKHKESEQLMLLALNSKSVVLGEFIISTGTVNSSIASPREIFMIALRAKAVSIILLHNHPSGDPTPSREDEIVTRRIKEAGDMIGISLIDHIIIGNNNYISFREKGYL